MILIILLFVKPNLSVNSQFVCCKKASALAGDSVSLQDRSADLGGAPQCSTPSSCSIVSLNYDKSFPDNLLAWKCEMLFRFHRSLGTIDPEKKLNRHRGNRSFTVSIERAGVRILDSKNTPRFSDRPQIIQQTKSFEFTLLAEAL